MKSLSVVLGVAAVTVAGAFFMPQSLEAKGIYALISLMAFLPAAWYSTLEPSERAYLLRCPTYFRLAWKRE
jgi:hypothetical protein